MLMKNGWNIKVNIRDLKFTKKILLFKNIWRKYIICVEYNIYCNVFNLSILKKLLYGMRNAGETVMAPKEQVGYTVHGTSMKLSGKRTVF